MIADSVNAIVPVYRADAGNIGLFQSTTAALSDRGGNSSSGVQYGTESPDYSAVVQAIKTQAVQLINSYGASRTGIYLAAFDEAVTILQLAAVEPVLSTVRWYGGDGTALSATLIHSASAASFASNVSFACPTVGLEESASDRWKPVAQEIKSRTGIEPDAFALAAYDAVWVLAIAFQSTGGSDDIALLRTAFLKTADQYYGATGWTALNSNGDRKNGNFDFWCIEDAGGQYTWRKCASYNSLSGTITRY
jgi:branched-chain amino acid transport system substrate-binding protein